MCGNLDSRVTCRYGISIRYLSCSLGHVISSQYLVVAVGTKCWAVEWFAPIVSPRLRSRQDLGSLNEYLTLSHSTIISIDRPVAFLITANKYYKYCRTVPAGTKFDYPVFDPTSCNLSETFTIDKHKIMEPAPLQAMYPAGQVLEVTETCMVLIYHAV